MWRHSVRGVGRLPSARTSLLVLGLIRGGGGGREVKVLLAGCG